MSFSSRTIQLLLMQLLLCAPFVSSTIRYVTPSGAGAQNGSDWANAYPGSSLQSAITASSSGDQVWVASGTYQTTATNDRSISFSMKEGVAIYGSFNGTETALSQRTLTNGPTSILTGEIGSAGISDNSYRVIINSDLSSASILDGFVIRDGNDDRTATASEGLGGGVYNAGTVSGNCSPTFRHCVFTNNRATYGAGVFNNGFNGRAAQPLFSHCVFANNTATGAGGGMDNFGVTGNASPTITNCLFYNNSAPVAGGLYNWGGDGGNASPSILNSAFVNNSATGGNAGGIIADNLNQFGGNSSGTSAPVLRNTILWGNSATGSGPQFSVAGTGTVTATYSIIDMSGQSSPHVLSGGGNGNTTGSPEFVSISNGIGADNNWMTGDDGLRLLSTSPAVDAGENTGVPTADLINFHRIANSTVDVGPYEYGSTVLPVELVSFTAAQHGNGVLLKWRTATEVNNHGFEVERKADSRFMSQVSGGNPTDMKPETSIDQWSRIAFVEGNGTSNSPHEYSFTDRSLSAGSYSYRLKQIDRDGKFEYSPELFVNVDVTPGELSLEQNYPNPFNPATSIRYHVPVSGHVRLTVYDAVGRETAILVNETREAGSYSAVFTGTNLSSGLYFVRLTSSNRERMIRMLMLK